MIKGITNRVKIQELNYTKRLEKVEMFIQDSPIKLN